MNESTPSQLQAIAAEGDVLVVAAAGAGKTRTLVERCLKRVLRADDPVSLDEVLMVTFTEAAAAEMRQRIRTELERRQAAAPDDAHLAEQLALLDTAAISTLHSFCLKLVREHFYDLQLDPQLTVLDDAQSRALAGETLDRVLQRHYAGTSPADEAVRELILTQGGGWDGPIRELVRRVHTYSQTLADPQGWRRAQLAAFEPGGAAVWEQWLIEGIAAWRYDWLEALQAVDPKNPNAQQCVKALRELPVPRTPEQIGELLARILAVDVEWPKGLKTKLRAPLAKLFDEAQFLQSVTRRAPDAGDPLAEDWEWVRPHMKALVELAGEFADEFAAAKREAGGVDFHDLEQFALQLLWDRERDQPTPVALRWRERLRLVFVDEYQDINAAQDCIITAISRDGAGANRFLVGDVKQSIYRFRLANPRIILGHDHDWRDGRSRAQVISLSENFRSHEAILQFINPVFEALLRPEIGGVDYPDEARLRFGAPALRRELSLATDASPRVELHLRLTSKEDADDNGADGESLLADLGSAEREARLVAQRLHELHTQRINVWKDQHWQPVEWRDMVVLLRSPRGKAECYAREFARLGVPLEVARGGFYDTTEVTDLLSLLQLLDNPLQDVPALAVLRSPLAGLTLDELGVVRLAERRGRFWIALLKFHRDATRLKLNFSDPAIHAAVDSARPKVDAFLKSFARWRQLARQGALSHCLETVLDETHYEDWLLAQPRGAQRRANVGRLLAMTRQFDPYQRQGLFRFLNFVAAQEEMGVETGPAPAESGDAVRLMSIHQSKGLEFPIVVLANLGGRFNFEDLKANVILDDHYGLCPQVKAPVSEQRYVSLPYWLAARRQRRETLGEELRLLYVALTRACDRLILTGTATRKRAEDRWAGATIERLGTREITGTNCFL
ncbi:MAG TPA: UvrD-helicase domain-containing protein, partial [Verrucomicrobiae bacterium]